MSSISLVGTGGPAPSAWLAFEVRIRPSPPSPPSRSPYLRARLVTVGPTAARNRHHHRHPKTRATARAVTMVTMVTVLSLPPTAGVRCDRRCPLGRPPRAGHPPRGRWRPAPLPSGGPDDRGRRGGPSRAQARAPRSPPRRRL